MSKKGPRQNGATVNRTPGSATSASKVGQQSGKRPRALLRWVWIGGREQRWVAWMEIERQVAEAHRQWRMRMALRGVHIADRDDVIDAQIKQHLKQRKP
jgi:hypothetical protein